MSFWEDAAGAVATGGASLLPGTKQAWDDITGKSGADAAERAAALQQAAADRATAENARQFDIGQANLAPWLKSGRKALAEQEALMGLGGDTSGMMRALQASPGYQARLLQGQRALQASQAAGGGLGSGKALTAASEYNQDYAANEYGNRLNQLAGLSGTGQSTASTMGGLGANYAMNQGNIWTGMANAQGAAGMAGANARQSGLLGVLNLGARAYGAK